MPEILQKSSKTRDQFRAISDLQNNEEHVLFQAGNTGLSVGGARARMHAPKRSFGSK